MKKTKKTLFRLGIRSTLHGFRYLCYALELCKQNEDYLLAVYKRLYADVAEHFGVSRDSVEHCLRTIVDNCWNRGNRQLLIEMSGCDILSKPTAGEFIDILYHYLNSEED